MFRVFPMEVLAGEPNTMVTHVRSSRYALRLQHRHCPSQKQNNCNFTFDFAEVYWNSRLDFEHARIIDLFKEEDVVADVFAGVGPFALPAAKKGCAVYANDLNPSSYKYLLLNMRDNKVRATTFGSALRVHSSPLTRWQVEVLVRPSCMDGREFIRGVFNRNYDDPMPPVPPRRLSARKQAEQLKRARRATSPLGSLVKSSPGSPPPPGRRRITQFVMNLPEQAMEFLDAFRGVLSPENTEGRGLSGIYDSQEKMPTIHCYAFTRLRDEELAAAELQKVCTAVPPRILRHAHGRWPVCTADGDRVGREAGRGGVLALGARRCAEQGDVLP